MIDIGLKSTQFVQEAARSFVETLFRGDTNRFMHDRVCKDGQD